MQLAGMGDAAHLLMERRNYPPVNNDSVMNAT
jgi:hypothetical protein